MIGQVVIKRNGRKSFSFPQRTSYKKHRAKKGKEVFLAPPAERSKLRTMGAAVRVGVGWSLFGGTIDRSETNSRWFFKNYLKIVFLLYSLQFMIAIILMGVTTWR